MSYIHRKCEEIEPTVLKEKVSYVLNFGLTLLVYMVLIL